MGGQLWRRWHDQLALSLTEVLSYGYYFFFYYIPSVGNWENAGKHEVCGEFHSLLSVSL